MSKRRKIILFAVLGFSLCAIVGVGALYWVSMQAIAGFAEAMEPARSDIDDGGFIDYFGIPLPDGATDFQGVAYGYWQSRVSGVRFRLPSSQLSEFLSELGFTQPLKEGLDSFSSTDQLLYENTWAKPESIEHSIGGRIYRVELETSYEVVVDIEDPDTYVIYLLITQD